MILGIMADTHDHIPNLKKTLDVFKLRKVEHILHAGDMVSPFNVFPFKKAGIPVTAVYGNNEGEWLFLDRLFRDVGEIKKGPIEIELSGKKIALMHEPVFLPTLAESGDFSLVVYGHTHAPHLEKKSALLLNPGEVCGYLTGKATAAVCDLETLEAEIIEI